MTETVAPYTTHQADQTGDVEVFADDGGESYLAIGMGDKLMIRPLTYQQEPEFEEYSLPSQIASVAVVKRGGETLSQILVVTTYAQIYSFRAGRLELLWEQEMSCLTNPDDVDLAWENVSEQKDYLIICFGPNAILFDLKFSGNVVSGISQTPVIQSDALAFNHRSVFRKIACKSETYAVASAKLEAMGDDLTVFDCIQLDDALIWVQQENLVLACIDSDIEILVKDKKRLKSQSGLVILPGQHKVESVGINPVFCHLKLDEGRILICWDGELFLLCIHMEKKARSKAMGGKKKKKISAKSKTTLKKFETFSLGPFTPARWLVRIQQNLFLAISREYDSFYFQLSSRKPYYKVVSFCKFSPSLPITHLEVFQGGMRSGPWKVESKSILFSQGKAQRSLLTLEEDCIHAKQVLLKRLPSDDVYHSLWGIGKDMLIVEGTRKVVCLQLNGNLTVERQIKYESLIDGILHAADNKVITRNKILCLQSNGEMNSFNSKNAALWGKVCKGYSVIVTFDDGLECYDEKNNLVYQETLKCECLFFQAERANDSILVMAARCDGIIECRFLDLNTLRCEYTQKPLGKLPNSGVIEQVNEGFRIYLGCEQGYLTLLTFNTEHQIAPQEISLHTSEELLITHLLAPNRIVLKSCTETFIADIDLELQVCRLSVVPSLRTAQGMTNIPGGLVMLDDASRLSLLHLAQTSTTQRQHVPLKGFIETFSTVQKDRHHHLVGIVSLKFKESLTTPPESFLTVVDVRTRRQSPTVVVPSDTKTRHQINPFLSEENKRACFILRANNTDYIGSIRPDCTVQLKEMSRRNTLDRKKLEAELVKQSARWLTGNYSTLGAGFRCAVHFGKVHNSMIAETMVSRPLAVQNLFLSFDEKGIVVQKIAKDFRVSSEHFGLTEQLNAAATDVRPDQQSIWVGTARGNIYEWSLGDEQCEGG